ncbi:MAG: hypothetical protein AAF945_08850, partial [Actinomycetota bacterium]
MAAASVAAASFVSARSANVVVIAIWRSPSPRHPMWCDAEWFGESALRLESFVTRADGKGEEIQVTSWHRRRGSALSTWLAGSHPLVVPTDWDRSSTRPLHGGKDTMRINQNTQAINAYRNLSTNNMSLGKSLEKLSSGFRINRAADDASGLVISQNLRSQIGGLRQATRNAQDGISVVQTAEGALSEVHNILGRMRDLAVQAANSGSNDTEARNAAQAEIDALTAEVNRISDKTAFGGQNLLDGSYGTTAGTLSSFDADGDFTFAAADTIDVTVAGGSGTVSVALAAGTFSGANAAASIESS